MYIATVHAQARGLAPPPPGNLKVKQNKGYQRKL